jgi:hypothetical protein
MTYKILVNILFIYSHEIIQFRSYGFHSDTCFPTLLLLHTRVRNDKLETLRELNIRSRQTSRNIDRDIASYRC